MGFVEKIAGETKYDMQGTEASTVCSDYLHTSLATWDEVADANANKRFVSWIQFNILNNMMYINI